MIRGTWRDPNFKFNAVDPQGHVHEHICYADSDVALRTRLEGKTLQVQWIEPYDFTEWKERARRATRRAIGQRVKDRWTHFRAQAAAHWPWLTAVMLDDIGGDLAKLRKAIVERHAITPADAERAIDEWLATITEEQPQHGQAVPKTAIAFAERIWRELKWHLFDLFHGKCAYCEHKPLAGYVGDVEHFRPKGKVDEDPNHPGYYWLAYNETNLLPSCAACNQYRTSKLTRFPVAGQHAREAQSLATEEPLLLNPYNQAIDPLEHLEFNEAGVSAPRNASKFGEHSRKIYYLDRPGLGEERFQAMQAVEQDWKVRIGYTVSISQAYTNVRDLIQTGHLEYAAARLWALERLRNRTIEELRALPTSLTPLTTLASPPSGAGT